MFRMNVAVWGAASSARAILPAGSIAEVESELDELAASPSGDEIAWDMHQVIYKAAAI